MARPKKDINQDQFEAMCSILCTEDEICGVFGVTDKTLNRWCRDTYNMGFYDIYKKKSAYGKMSLRRKQFKIADTNASMAIFLGKQYLGQKDVVENDVNQINEVKDIVVKIKKVADEANNE